MEFKIGDKVRLIGKEDGIFRDGVFVWQNDSFRLVEFKTRITDCYLNYFCWKGSDLIRDAHWNGVLSNEVKIRPRHWYIFNLVPIDSDNEMSLIPKYSPIKTKFLEGYPL